MVFGCVTALDTERIAQTVLAIPVFKRLISNFPGMYLAPIACAILGDYAGKRVNHVIRIRQRHLSQA